MNAVHVSVQYQAHIAHACYKIAIIIGFYTVEPFYSGHCLGQGLLPVIKRWPDYTCILQ